MYFFTLLYLVAVLVRPQEYPQWADSGIPILPILLLLAFLSWLASRGKDLSAPQYALLFAFQVVLMLSQVFNGWTGGALQQLSTFGPGIMAFLVLSHAAVERKRVLSTMAVIVLSAALLSVHGIEQVTQGVGWTGVGLSQETRIQYVGIFNDPNDLGLLFAMTVPMALLLGTRGGLLGLRRLFWWAGAGLIGYGIFLTSSRGALLAVIAILGVWVWRRRGLVTAMLLGVGALAAIMALPSRMGDIDAGEASAAERVDAWYSGFEMFFSNPLFGIGPGNFADNNANLTAHNSFMLVLGETGFIGYTIWLAFVCYGFMMMLAILRHQPELADATRQADWKQEQSIALTLLLCQTGFFTAAFFLSRSYVILLYLLAALVLGFYSGARQRYPDLPRFELTHDLLRWPMRSLASIVGLYLLVKILLVTSS